MKNRIVLFIVGFIVWLLLYYPADTQHIIIGAIVALIVALIAGDLFTSRPRLFLHPWRYFWLFYFILIFIVEWLKVNIKIALRLIRPNIPLNPAILKVKTELKTSTALTFLANTLTLALETITIEVNQKDGDIYLHCIEVDGANSLGDNSKFAIERFERIIKKIFE
jgi:multicomponent Na+:H+ antiporter subunit E